jgi:HEAT repeat protein
MPEVTPLSPELSRAVSALARSLVAAARTWTLYPPEHPAVRSSVERLGKTLQDATGKFPFTFGVTPDTLLLDGVPATKTEGGPVTEAAGWLHHRDILQITFVPEVPPAALEKFLALLSEDPRQVRERGGPAKVWQNDAGHASILIEQIDFSKVLEERENERPARNKDDLWRAIVRAVLDRRKTLDESIQKRMLEIAGDIFAIGELANDVMAPNCSADGSPMLTSQAAAVVAAYRHLVGIVDVLAPDRRAEVMNNLAAATASLDPRVVMQILSSGEELGGGLGSGGTATDVRRGIADAFDDTKVAQLLATTLALDGQASDRLASVFDTIAPDDSRKQRVLTLTRTMLSETAFGKTTQFQTLWTSMEELLLSYNERPFVSADYRTSLDSVGARGASMASDIPEELAELVHTLDQDNVRRLSTTLLIDLLNIEQDAERAPEIARDVAALGEDLLMAGDYTGALDVTRALSAHARDPKSVAQSGARVALDGLVNTAAFHEAVDALNDLDDTMATALGEICAVIGAPATDALRQWLEEEKLTRGRQRATALLRGFGAPAVNRLAPLVSSRNWFTQRNLADLLGEIASAEAVPLLQPLLRGSDGRVTQAAVRALANIDDPSAARAVHTVLRAAAGNQRQAVVAALVAERDPRVVPLLVRILDESDALGDDHPIVLETLGAVAAVGGDGAIPAVDRVIRKRRWFARQKVRALKQTGVRTLRQIDTPAAKAALDSAASTGDRLLRRVVKEAGAA